MENNEMKSLLEYFDPDKDSYEYTIKIALEGDMEDDEMQDGLEVALKRYDIVALEHVDTTPIQRSIESFPNYRNIRAAIFRVATEYPISIQQMVNIVADDLGIADGQVCVCKDYDPEEDNAESLLYHEEDEASEEFDPYLADPDYSEVEELEEELHGNDFMEKNNEDIEKGSQERQASVRVWQSDLIPSEKTSDTEKDEGVQYNHNERNSSPLTDTYLNDDNDYENEEGQLSPLLRESIDRLKIPRSEKALLKKLIMQKGQKE